MKFAMVNGQKTESQPKLQGICAHCQSETLSKCGNVKIWHWAHRSKISCDPWWENETEWHRKWKNHFPTEWQEKTHIDNTTGEKHVADIKTSGGLVIEFQHSAIQPTEAKSREAFYKKMVWVVDGTRLKRDCPRFFKRFSDLRPTGVAGFFRLFFPEECLPASWLTSSVPVYFDFQGSNPLDQREDLRAPLWCLFPGRVGAQATLAGVRREQFIEFSSNTPHLLFAHEHLSLISEYDQLQSEIAASQVRRAIQPINPLYPQYAGRRRGRRL